MQAPPQNPYPPGSLPTGKRGMPPWGWLLIAVGGCGLCLPMVGAILFPVFAQARHAAELTQARKLGVIDYLRSSNEIIREINQESVAVGELSSKSESATPAEAQKWIGTLHKLRLEADDNYRKVEKMPVTPTCEPAHAALEKLARQLQRLLQTTEEGVSKSDEAKFAEVDKIGAGFEALATQCDAEIKKLNDRFHLRPGDLERKTPLTE